jgi:hypothetical protein
MLGKQVCLQWTGRLGKNKPMLFRWATIASLAIAMAFAVVIIAPSVANAHAGHGQAATAGSIDQAPAPLSGIDEGHSADVQAAVVASTAGTLGDGSANGAGCVGGCCKSAMACCTALLAAPVEIPWPDARIVRLTFWASPDKPGLAPDGPRRPPRTFA